MKVKVGDRVMALYSSTRRFHKGDFGTVKTVGLGKNENGSDEIVAVIWDRASTLANAWTSWLQVVDSELEKKIKRERRANVSMKMKTFLNRLKAIGKGKTPGIVWDTQGDGHKTLFLVERRADMATFEDAEGESYYVQDEDDLECVKKIVSLKKGLRQKLRKLYDEKRPKNRKRHVGVEIEMISKLSAPDLSMLIANAGLENNVNVKDDGSINTTSQYPNEHEICILSDEKNIYKVVSKLCKLIEGNSTVNKSCGLHVHLDMRNRDGKKAYANLFAAQPLLYSMCPKSRVNGTYSAPVKDYRPFDIKNRGSYVGDNRYVGVNKTSYDRHKTIEIRIHSGTISAQKINNWIKLLLKIVDSPIRNTEKVELVKSMSAMQRKLKLSGMLKKYVKERVDKFKDHHEDGRDSIKIAA